MFARKNPLKNNFYLLGRRIQHYRIKRGYTQELLAQTLRVSLNHIGKIETGTSKPSLDLVFKIAKVLDIELSKLFDF